MNPTQCPKNAMHQMAVRSVNTPYSCDGCGAQRMQVGEPHYRCDADNVDFCNNCRPVGPGGMNPGMPGGMPGGGMPGGIPGGLPICPRGHQMAHAMIKTYYSCDKCGRKRPEGEIHARCGQCNYDFCPDCVPVRHDQVAGGPGQGVVANPAPPGMQQGGAFGQPQQGFGQQQQGFGQPQQGFGGQPQQQQQGGLGSLFGSLLQGGSLSGLLGGQQQQGGYRP
ncbi:hypothetical protein DFJ74DRAFT_684823 [Hyaloraphidium curvatum]|nr:hypothetical protein DFJ74DRAFT_684823 [Hyaloraphidium curvatum]